MMNALRRTFRLPVLAVLILCIIGLSASTLSRFGQYSEWQKQPDLYFHEGTPMMATLDAYKWIRYAREYGTGSYTPGASDQIMYYPDGLNRPDPVPMLSVMMSKISGLAGIDLYHAGIYLVPVLASLFIIPLVIYMSVIGYPLAGFLGGMVGTFGLMYYIRTSIGRVDTDLMNLFFPLLASLFILLAGKDPDNPKRVRMYGALAGVAMLLFMWWYDHAGFTPLYGGVLVVYLFICRVHWKTVLVAFLFFLLFSNPAYFLEGLGSMMEFVKGYVFTKKAAAGGYPNVYQTVTEAQHRPVTETLAYIFESASVGGIGLLLFAVMCAVYPKVMIPLLPVIGLGFLSFKSSVRFVMFLAPFAGVGFGYAASLLLSMVMEKVQWKQMTQYVTATVLGVALMGLTMTSTATAFVPPPAVPADMFGLFRSMGDKLPAGSALFSWWDFGLAIEDASGIATAHDGMNQGTPKTYYIARSFASSSQEELYRTVAFLGTKGMREIGRMQKEQGMSADNVTASILSHKEPVPKDTLYLLFTRDMIQKFSAINMLGSWDTAAGASASTDGIYPLTCTEVYGDVLTCNGMKINVKDGLVNGQPTLSAVMFSENGTLERGAEFPGTSGGMYLVVMTKNHAIIGALAMPEQVFRSNFTQMYLLGQFDKNRFAEVINDFPSMRVLALKP